MKNFDNNILDIVLESQLKIKEKEMIQIMHEECHFYANDG